MPGLTPHFSLQWLVQGDAFSTNGYQFTYADRLLIDRLLYLGAEGHHHSGVSAASDNPTQGPTLAVNTTTGFLPASTRVHYKFTYVDPSGFETAASPETFVDLPAQTATPNPPTVAANPGTGTLPAGGYFYELSAYTGTNNTSETPASAPAYVTLNSVGENILTLPALPSGATGFNVYRLGPAESHYLYIGSIAMNLATPPTTWLDDGTRQENCNRFAPLTNTTQSTNQVTATIPAAPPTGFTWNVYRSLVTGNWSNSFLANVTSGLSYVDVGLGTTAGSPPATSGLVGSPTKVLLTGGAEVQGILPASMVDYGTTSMLPFSITFTFSGALTPLTGVENWVCPFTKATITNVTCSLGRGSKPASQPVVVDVLHGTSINPTYTSIFTTSLKPQVPVGQQIGSPAVPNTSALNVGDSLGVDLLQAGGGATPTDHDLTVNIYMLTSP